MDIQGVKTFVAYMVALALGIVASIVSLISPIREEVPQLMKQSTPTPFFTENTRELSKEESSTMSASFIKEFETLMSSGAGERK
jgi:hypothetical protein